MSTTLLFFLIGFAAAGLGYGTGYAVWRWSARPNPTATAHLLRHYARRALVCWEGNDADDAAVTMMYAADLLDAER